MKVLCKLCNGTGTLMTPEGFDADGKTIRVRRETCYECNGTGVADYPSATIAGGWPKGEVQTEAPADDAPYGMPSRAMMRRLCGKPRRKRPVRMKRRPLIQKREPEPIISMDGSYDFIFHVGSSMRRAGKTLMLERLTAMTEAERLWREAVKPKGPARPRNSYKMPWSKR